MADKTYIHISELPTLTAVQENTWVAVETDSNEGRKVDLSTLQPGGGGVQSDWNQDDSTQPDFIKNKPTIPSLDGYATEQWVEDKEYLTSADLTGYAKQNEVDEIISTVNDITDVVEENTEDIATLSAAISGLPTQVQSDWAEEDSSDPAFIKNKPDDLDISAGEGISIIEDGSSVTFSVTGNYADATQVNTEIGILSGAIDDKVDVTEFNEAIDDINDNFEYVYRDISAISGSISEQVQSDWAEEDSDNPAYIKNKPEDLDISAGEGISITEDGGSITFAVTGDYADATEVAGKIDTLSGTIDDNFDTLSAAISAMPTQVQSDWTEDDPSDPAFIKNKPTELNMSAGEGISITEDAGTLTFDVTGNYADATEVADDISYLSGAISSIPAQVQSDWTEDDSTDPAYIKNKPADLTMSAGEGISITEDAGTLTFDVTGNYADADEVADNIEYLSGAISSIPTQVQSDWTEDDSTDPAFIKNKPADLALSAGNGIGITDDGTDITISVTAGYEENVIDDIKVAGTSLTVTNKSVNFDMIPAHADVNDRLVTNTDMAAAIADFGGFEVVSADQQGYPNVSDANTRTVYLVQDTAVTGADQYKEWIWKAADPEDPQSTSAWNLIGDTTIDLNGYVQFPGSYTANHLVQFGANDTISDAGYTVSELVNVQSDWEEADSADPAYIQNKPAPLELTGGTYIDITTANNRMTIDADLSAISAGLSLDDYANVQSDWNESDSASDAYIANKPSAVLIPEASPAALGGFAAPTNIMVVTAMPTGTAVNPTTIYLVKEST